MTDTQYKRSKKQELAQKILDFAEKVAETESWEAVTMRRISAEIKYSLPIIYDHFKNKEEIVSTLAIKGFKILLESLHEADEQGGSTREIAHRLAHVYIKFGFSHRALYLAMYGQEGISSFMTKKPIEAKRVFDFIQNWLKNLVKQKIANIPNTWEATKLVWATLHGLIALQNLNQVNDDKISIDQVVDDFINLLMDHWNVA